LSPGIRWGARMEPTAKADPSTALCDPDQIAETAPLGMTGRMVTPSSHVKFTLRSYDAGDFETLYGIDQACFDEAIAYSRRDLRAYLKFLGAECVVGEANAAHIAGFCISARQARQGHNWGYIITMDVLPKYRRHGLATALLDEAERRMAMKKVTEVWLETATDNDPAIAFWQKHGYRKRGVQNSYYPDGRDAFTMQKILPNTTEPAPQV
jgi:ribosomal-protein-alanine N-acetyltransferase